MIPRIVGDECYDFRLLMRLIFIAQTIIELLLGRTCAEYLKENIEVAACRFRFFFFSFFILIFVFVFIAM